MSGHADVLVVGFNTMDLIFTGSEALLPDQKVYAQGLTQMAGGQGCNVAVDLAGLGLTVRYQGMFGDDTWGDQSRGSLSNVGVDVSGSVVVADCPNHVAVVIVDTAGTRSIVMCKDPRLTPSAQLVTADSLDGVQALYTDGHEFELSVAAAELASGLGVRVFADLEVVRPDSARLLQHVDELVAPVDVILGLAGTDDEVEALKTVRALGPEVVVATKGAAGCAGLDESGDVFALPAHPATVRDTTGAGDAFHAGFISVRLRGGDVRAAAAVGNQVGAIKCELTGPRVPASALSVLRKQLESGAEPTEGPAS